jgi:hypothetical protein
MTISAAPERAFWKVPEDPAVKMTSYPGTVRQLVVTGPRRDAPTAIITNDTAMKTRALVTQYACRMTTGQRLAEIIRAFCADALSSTVNLNIDLDVVLAVLAQALTAALRARLPGSRLSPPTPSSGGSWKPPARSSPPATPSPSASNAAPSHPSSGQQTCHPPPPSHGGAAVLSATSLPEVAANLLRGIRANEGWILLRC